MLVDWESTAVVVRETGRRVFGEIELEKICSRFG